MKKTLKTKCLPAALSNPKNMSVEDIVQMGSLALDLDRNVLREMDSQTLCDSRFISMVKENPKAKARVVSTTCIYIKTLKLLLFSLPKSVHTLVFMFP